MTEEIIIDGVDVAGCPDIKQYNDTEGNMMCMEYIDGSCEGHNCFFKQLKRLEQENEKLRYKIQEVVQANDRIVAECTEIMKPKCETSMISELMKENETLTKENKNSNNWIISLNKKCEELIKEKLNHRSALEEIKSIIINDNSILVDKKDYIELQCGEPIAFKLQKIYNKINEILDKG